MLRINLLPPYIHDKNKKRNIGIGWVLAVAAVIALLLAMNTSVQQKLADAQKEKDEATTKKATTDGYKKNIADELAARAIIESKQKFVADSRKYNDAWPEAFDTIRDVTPNTHDIILKSMVIDPGSRRTVTLDGWGSSEETVVRWWMSLRNNTDLFEHVNFQLPTHDWPPKSTNAAGGGPGGPSSMGGMGGPKAGGLTMSTPGGMGPGGPSSMGGMGGRPGGGGGNAKDEIGPAMLRGRMGLNFVASIMLKKALADGIATPTWPAGAAPAGGGGGMPMGPMSGAPGPMTGGAPGVGAGKGNVGS